MCVMVVVDVCDGELSGCSEVCVMVWYAKGLGKSEGNATFIPMTRQWSWGRHRLLL